VRANVLPPVPNGALHIYCLANTVSYERAADLPRPQEQVSGQREFGLASEHRSCEYIFQIGVGEHAMRSLCLCDGEGTAEESTEDSVARFARVNGIRWRSRIVRRGLRTKPREEMPTDDLSRA
jgi:hypothetical protein